jgi:hypothetical protein
MAQCPDDVVNIIIKYYTLFQQRHAIDRVEDFRTTYTPTWSLIMTDIRANTPRYRIKLKSFTDQIMTLSLYSPDCDIHSMSFRQGSQSWQLSCIRRALSVESPPLRGIIRNEIIEPYDLL